MAVTFYSKKSPNGFRMQLSFLTDETLYNKYSELGYVWVYDDYHNLTFSPSVFDFIPFEIDTQKWGKIGMYPKVGEMQFINNDEFVRRYDESFFDVLKEMEIR